MHLCNNNPIANLKTNDNRIKKHDCNIKNPYNFRVPLKDGLAETSGPSVSSLSILRMSGGDGADRDPFGCMVEVVGK